MSSSSSSEVTPSRGVARPDMLASSRLSVLSALGAASAILPLPFVPATIERHLRGAVVQDVASRHGLTLTLEAREALSQVLGNEASRRVLNGAARYFMRAMFRRVGPLSVLAPARTAAEIFALGVLFERYVTQVRRGPTIRVNAAEARGLREAIDRAVLRALSPHLTPAELPAPPSLVEDFRDDMTRLIDSFLLTGAGLPGYLLRRMESAFDEVVAERPELVDG